MIPATVKLSAVSAAHVQSVTFNGITWSMDKAPMFGDVVAMDGGVSSPIAVASGEEVMEAGDLIVGAQGSVFLDGENTTVSVTGHTLDPEFVIQVN